MLELNFNSDIFKDIKTVSSKDIAIIGIDVKLPMADNLDEFWDNLVQGRDCVGELPDNRQRDIEEYLRYRNGSSEGTRYATGGYLNAIDNFDNEFFKISNKEANLMDPNQKIFLESAWKAIEDSGYGGKNLVGSRTGVYVGFTPRGEYRKLITEVEPESLTVSETGNLSSIVASRISYLMDFRGPSMIVNTECSSSLVAVHLACQSLRNGECDMAIAGGVRISFSPIITDQKLGIESEQGKVCTFDDDSDGAVFGEGSVAIVLKPIDKAVKDKDNIYAVIKGSAVNQDGASVGITAPNLLAQEDVIVNAWKDAEIEPETITYIETHGTGTKLGDPIEVNGISRAFKRFTNKKQFCGVGSVKTNIAHLDNVAGIASLVKVVLALKNRKIPPTINFRIPNRKINFENSAVYINNRLSEWEAGEAPRRCGISSFGLSGTNCHMILEEAPAVSPITPSQINSIGVFTISAAKESGALNIVKEVLDNITKNKNIELGDICYTSNTGRGHYNFRIAVIARNIDELADSLKEIYELGIENVKSGNILLGRHYIIPNNKRQPEKDEIYEHQKKELTNTADSITELLTADSSSYEYDLIVKLCKLYVQGAEVDWYQLYKNGNYRRVSLPTYPFEKKRCWLAIPDSPKSFSQINTPGQSYNHPLLDKLAIESVTQDIYLTDFTVKKHWVLKEHNILGKYLVPGTVYLEMARDSGSTSVINFLYSPLGVNPT
ncbi:MAG TPA: beta-ketoacyl synthase N-terminal-like domain-containing protein [Ruminiclostridium sp.]|nr:beta-ketoacyl synthase N-terminal-like domain-containing protein [Ruminiclostridium sp.]